MERRIGLHCAAVVCLAAVGTTSAFDYAAYAGLLNSYVHDGSVAYGAMDRDERLADSIRRFAAARPDAMSDADRLAFWINAYNLTVLRSVINHDIPAKVTDVPGFFDREEHRVAGEDLTLDEIEHERIRTFGDPRIHCAIVCAARSCPKLQSRPFTGDRLDEDLDRACREFLADPSRNRVDFEHNRLHLSMVFDWFKDDFGGTDGVRGFVRRYGPAERYAVEWRTADWEKIRISYNDYDWTLNDAGARSEVTK